VEDGRLSSRAEDLLRWADDLDLDRILVIGDPDPGMAGLVASIGCEVRWTQNPLGRSFKAPLMAFRSVTSSGPWCAVLNPSAPESVPRTWTWSTLPSDDPLDMAFYTFDTLWSQSSPMAGQSMFKPGDLVGLMGSPGIGRVKAARRVGDSYEYTVTMDGLDQQVPEASLVLQAGDPRDPDFWLRRHPASAASMARTLTWTKIRHPLTDVIYSFRSSRTVFRTYQFRPVLKMINSDNRRLLIADEVGLGKTIEAGLVWNELEQRGEIKSALVVCPSTLRFKWQRELRIRFERDISVLDRAALERWVEDLERGEGRDFHGIVSLELFRASTEVLERLEALSPRIDLVIVDEAHYLRNVGTRSNKLGALLAEWADALMFLSATPLNLHQDDLFNLLTLLDEETFPSSQLLQEQIEPNRAINAAARVLIADGRREPRLVLQQLAPLKSSIFGRILQSVPDYRLLSQILDRPTPLELDEIARAKRHLFELHTLAPVFTRTRKVDTHEEKAIREPRDCVVVWTDEERALYDAIYAEISAEAARTGKPAGFVMQMPLRQAASCLPVMQQRLLSKSGGRWSDEDESDIEDDNEGLPLPGAVIARPLPVDSKYQLFLTTIRDALEVGEGQALVFSFFQGTLEYLLKRLSQDLPSITKVALMYGPTPAPERERIMERFRRGEIHVLLCSEVGAEGLDLQECNVLVNYDLPWNPMRVEQRIGRLDRFGQKAEKIFIFNMQVPGTIETDILNRLYTRIGIFRDTIGDLEPILRDFDHVLGQALDPHLTPDQREAKLVQLGVALESRTQDIEELSTTDSLMNGIGDMLVDGFDEDSPGRGRFIGREELRDFVRAFLDQKEGKMRAIKGMADTFQITGGRELAQALRSVPRRSQSSVNPVQLAAMVEDEGFTVTFDEREAVAHGLVVVNVQHPLVQAALTHLGGDDLLLDRFGTVRIAGLEPARECTAGLFLVEARGIRPSLELLCVAVDADGEHVLGVGDQILSALAHARLEESPEPITGDVTRQFARIDQIRAEILHERNRLGIEANNALVDRRVAARQREFRLKIDRAQDTLAKVVDRGRSERIQRMNLARVHNLQARLDDVVAELESKRGYSIRSSPVAVLVVRP
jgi:superfamily II DNA or RNA helicase